jgi:hypothetical protein
LLRLSKKLYFENNLQNNLNNPKRTWDLLKEATNLNKTQQKIDKIISNGDLVSDPVAIAAEFNNFFFQIGTRISNSVKDTGLDPLANLHINPNLQCIDLGTVTPTHVCDILKSMSPKNSLDLYEISTKLLKCISLEISIPLAHIFNLSLTTGIFPKKLKTSRIVPIYKTGDPNLCDNYRPISLLSSISKILEKIVCVQLVNHLDRNNLLYVNQYGFQRGKSTEHNLIKVVNFVGNAINNGDYSLGVFFDLKKAFDVVPHDILLNKLNKLGIQGIAWNWFNSYLSERKQVVDIDGHVSGELDIVISVLQGSILGPILFLCFINDLYTVTKLLTVMFADDTCCLNSNKNLPDLIADTNNEINKIAVWFRTNKMALNVSKTKYIIFHSRNKKVDMTNLKLEYNANAQHEQHDNSLISPLERYHDKHEDKNCRAYKLLGIHFDEHLSLNDHVNYLCNKLSRSIYCINQAKNFLTLPALKSLYFALVHSHLMYCPIILSCTSNTNINRIFKLQKKAIRIITKSNFNAHTQELFRAHHILPYELMLNQAKLHFMHSYVYGYAPKSFNNTWIKNNQREIQHNLRNNDDFMLPMARIELYKKIPMYSLPLAWNAVGDIRFQQNKTTFRWGLKEKLLNELTANINQN